MKSDDVFLKPSSVDFDVGAFCHGLAKELFPICRSISGPGVRETLARLQRQLPALSIHEVESGTQTFDWAVPDEWIIRDAYVADQSGSRIIDFRNNNLHLLGYSEPVDEWLELAELERHLYSKPDQPTAIPYVTSYYARRWGFCLAHEQRQALAPGLYRAVVDSELRPGVLNYGELILPGQTTQEVLLSTYICHPSMANNELSGPSVTAALARWLMSLQRRRFTYRIVFIPETIGSIIYLSRHLDHLKRHVVAGFNITCVGDDRCYSYLPSRAGDTLSDRAALHVLKHIEPNFKRYTWLDRGSDERQYCAPGVDLPVATIMRSKYGEYPEYHTSLDDLSIVTESGLAGGFSALQQAIEAIENDAKLRMTVLCEPQLGKRGLYPTLNSKESYDQVRVTMDAISYCDGNCGLLEIADSIGAPMSTVIDALRPLLDEGLLEPSLH
jgi:aminopeptidase-like protein